MISDSNKTSKYKIVFRESNLSDSDSINEFFSQVPLEGKISLLIHRKIDFFSLYRKLGQQFINFVFEKKESDTVHINHRSEILGTASFLMRNRLMKNKTQKMAFACDLRISNNRKVITTWAQHYLPTLDKIKTLHNVDHFLTTLNLTEIKSINAFLRPKSFDSLIPSYELIERFNLAAIHGTFPFYFKKNKSIVVNEATDSDIPALINYLKKKILNYELVPTEYIENIELALHNSLIYSPKGFIIAKNAFGQIVGCAHPVHSSALQDYLPMAYDSQSNNFRQFLKFISFLGFGRNLTRPYSSTNKKQMLYFYILHFLNFDHPEVLKSILKFAYDRAADNEFIMYFYSKKDFSKRPPKGFIYSETPYGLYEISKRSLELKPHEIRTEKPIFLDDLWF